MPRCSYRALRCLVALTAACGGATRTRDSNLVGDHPVPLMIASASAAGRWMPASVDAGTPVQTLADGTRQSLLGRLRVEHSPTGRVQRATTLLDGEPPTAFPLPERLGGGFAFVANHHGTHVWRSPTFLAAPVPFAHTRTAGLQVFPGPDRLLVRSPAGDQLFGLDAKSGALVPPSPLPAGPRVGPLAYADAKRGLAAVDLRGLVATGDGGRTWRPLDVPFAGKELPVVDGAFLVDMPSERLRFDAGGNLTREALPAGLASNLPPRKPVPFGPFGPFPLRAAVEHGYPLADGTAIVFHAGRIGRIRLADGDVVAVSPDHYPEEEDAQCQAVRYAADVGFVCGSVSHGTTLYRTTSALRAIRVIAFADARIVVPAGNGALLVSDGCGPHRQSRETPPGRVDVCFLDAQGRAPRPVQFLLPPASAAPVRLTALSDGRIIVIVPPHDGTSGQIGILPASPAPARVPVFRPLRLEQRSGHVTRGLWTNGWVQTGPDEIGGWVDTGAATVGVRLRVTDATVTAGPLRSEGDTVVAGAVALTSFHEGRAWESTDVGRSWHPVDVPPMLQGRTVTERRCGPVGCVVVFEKETWLRVGWGPDETSHDFDDLPVLEAATTDRVIPSPLTLVCETSRVEAAPARSTKPPRVTNVVTTSRPPGTAEPAATGGPWLALAGTPPPILPAGHIGFDAGPAASNPQARLYAWLPKGTSHGEAARCQGRFFDRFDPAAGIRSTAMTRCPWPDETTLQNALGFGSMPVLWAAFPDPGGQATLLSACRNQRCELYGLLPGQAVTRLPEADGEAYAKVLPANASVVRTDDAWFVAVSDAATVTVWRIDEFRGRVLARLPRINPASPEPIRLVRRARTSEIGIFAQGLGSFGRSDRDFYVLPVQAETGVVGTMQSLGPADLTGKTPPLCDATQDGWLTELPLPLTPVLSFSTRTRVGDVELRVRFATASERCLERLSGRLLDAPEKLSSGPLASNPIKPFERGRRNDAYGV